MFPKLSGVVGFRKLTGVVDFFWKTTRGGRFSKNYRGGGVSEATGVIVIGFIYTSSVWKWLNLFFGYTSEVNMDFCYHHERSFIIKKIRQLVPTGPPSQPLGRRHYIFELKPIDKRCLATPLTFNTQRIQEKMALYIDQGNLFRAYEAWWILGMNPDPELLVRYPWWKMYLDNYITAGCSCCGKDMHEDRGLSKYCSHQLCSNCALWVTEDAINDIIRCPICNISTIYILFNGEQCDDDRTHHDVILQ